MGKRSLRRVALGVMLSMMMMWLGCSTNWIEQAREIVSVLIPATTNLVRLAASLQGESAPGEDVARVEKAGMEASADLRLIRAFLATYEAANDANKPGILKDIQNAISAMQANLQGLMLGLHIKDAATQAKVTAIAGILLLEVESLAELVPLVQGEGTGARGRSAAAARVAMRRNHSLSASEFVRSYNATMTEKTGRAELDRVTGGLQLHGGSAGVE